MPEMPVVLAEQLHAWIAEVARDETRRILQNQVANDALSTSQAAELAGVSVYTIRKWVDAERITNIGAGRHLRVSRAALQQLMKGKKRRRRSAAKKMTPEQYAEELVGRSLDD